MGQSQSQQPFWLQGYYPLGLEGHCPLIMSIILNLDLSLATISDILDNNNYFKID